MLLPQRLRPTLIREQLSRRWKALRHPKPEFFAAS